MLTTTLPLLSVKTNTGMTAVFTVVGEREIYLGESPAQGGKRARIEVLSADPSYGSGKALSILLARLEREAQTLADRELQAAADDLGIDLAC